MPDFRPLWSLIRRRPWAFELGAVALAVAIWLVFFWLPGKRHDHQALQAFDAYTATMPAQWRTGRDIVEHTGSYYLVCSTRDDTAKHVRHLCLSVRTDKPTGKRVVGGYRITTIGYDLPTGDKSACFGFDAGECLDQ